MTSLADQISHISVFVIQIMPKLFGTDDVTLTSYNAKKQFFGIFLRWWPRQTQKLGHFWLSEWLKIFSGKKISCHIKTGKSPTSKIRSRIIAVQFNSINVLLIVLNFTDGHFENNLCIWRCRPRWFRH